MNQNAKTWVDALESGEFTQGYGRLRNRDSFCCLGVACELFRRATDQGSWKEEFKGTYSFFIDNDNFESAVLPPKVMSWLGINSRTGSLEGLPSLVTLNDSRYNFTDIARIIRENEEDLFE